MAGGFPMTNVISASSERISVIKLEFPWINTIYLCTGKSRKIKTCHWLTIRQNFSSESIIYLYIFRELYCSSLASQTKGSRKNYSSFLADDSFSLSQIFDTFVIGSNKYNEARAVWGNSDFYQLAEPSRIRPTIYMNEYRWDLIKKSAPLLRTHQCGCLQTITDNFIQVLLDISWGRVYKCVQICVFLLNLLHTSY